MGGLAPPGGLVRGGTALPRPCLQSWMGMAGDPVANSASAGKNESPHPLRTLPSGLLPTCPPRRQALSGRRVLTFPQMPLALGKNQRCNSHRPCPICPLSSPCGHLAHSAPATCRTQVLPRDFAHAVPSACVAWLPVAPPAGFCSDVTFSMVILTTLRRTPDGPFWFYFLPST